MIECKKWIERKRELLVTATLLLAIGAPLVKAESLPQAVKADVRIRTVPFQRDNIIYLAGMMGVSTMIVFNDDEKIATVAMGDSVAWQAVPDQSKQYLFIKPLEPNAVTNMNVVTSKRVYNFMLTGATPGNTRNAVIKLRFSYPEDAASVKLLATAKENASMPNIKAALANPAGLNYDYGYKGAVDNRPTAMFDDGTKTFFQFSGELPAFFAVKSDGHESLVNFRREGDYIVIDKVADQWTLRNGDVATCVFNLKKTAHRQPVVTVADDHHGGGNGH
ncbi:TrbG/VirB9 family P-type conjugative transfer protein (plasmid) [Rhizobium sp. CB3060]|uniref:TrbG/VirB9 family P-type conjugative transfer protein n=1 Tax=Rhizobium sp. CB3060 TaxID=3138255 RepID=UPI0021A5282F|nr:TrbG/VirB9 family P-type conjugative transfer protein [Rhizobium tropici]UWU26028.1 TrbG/VirB9 family P-type conjugative transfer protein [Rhizobium tropici]